MSEPIRPWWTDLKDCLTWTQSRGAILGPRDDRTVLQFVGKLSDEDIIKIKALWKSPSGIYPWGPSVQLPESNNNPLPIILHCPMCHTRHIDEGEFATKLHHTHACQNCGHCWRPAIVPTVGVRFLPGFKNEAQTDSSVGDA